MNSTSIYSATISNFKGGYNDFKKAAKNQNRVYMKSFHSWQNERKQNGNKEDTNSLPQFKNKSKDTVPQ